MDKRKQLISTVLLAWIFYFSPASTLQSRGQELLTLDKCMKLAVENSELLKIASEKIAAAKGAKQEAFGSYLPEITASGAYTRIQEVPAIMGYKMGDENNYSGKLSLRQPLFTWGKITQVLAQAKLKYHTAKEDYRKVKNELILNVKKSFYAVLLAKQLEKISREALDVMERHLGVTRALYREGKVSKLDVSRVKVQMINSKTQLIKAESELTMARKTLVNVINYSPAAGWELEGDLTKASGENQQALPELIEEAIKNRPEMKNAQTLKKIGKSHIKLARAWNRPHLALTGNYEHTKPYHFANKWDSSWDITCALTFPLFNGLSNLGKINQARAGLNQAVSGENLLREKIRLEVEKAYLNRQNAEERIETQKENVETAKENLDIVQKRYQRGLVSDLELRDTQLALTRAETEYSTALFDYNTAAAELAKAVGR